MTGSDTMRGERSASSRLMVVMTSHVGDAELTTLSTLSSWQQPVKWTSHGLPPLEGVGYVCVNTSTPMNQSSTTE